MLYPILIIIIKLINLLASVSLFVITIPFFSSFFFICFVSLDREMGRSMEYFESSGSKLSMGRNNLKMDFNALLVYYLSK